jgi:aminoglycoside 6'-N-acetyltransferase
MSPLPLAGAAADAYAVRRVRPDDLPLIAEWLKQPHVSEWWGTPDEQHAQIAAGIDDCRVTMLVLLLDGTAIGYAQIWAPEDWPGHPFADQPAGTRGLDAFIADPARTDQGHGSSFLRMLSERALAAGAPRVIVDPHPANARAVAAYARAGFVRAEVRDTADGPALLMIRLPHSRPTSR